METKDCPPGETLVGGQCKPRILDMLVHTIEGKPAFYSYPGDSQVYSLMDKAMVAPPSYLNMFKCRGLMPSDMGDVIMHNQLSEPDFALLQQKGLIPQELEILFTKIKDLKAEVEQLRMMMGQGGQEVAKSDEEQPSDVGSPSSEMIEAVINVVRAGIVGGSIGGGVFDQIMSATTGLSVQDKKILELVAEKFNLSLPSTNS